jgi:hypothetical protein
MNNSRTKAAVIGGALAGGVSLALLSPAAPAMAFDSGGVYFAITVQSPGTLIARGAAVDVTVDVTCNAQDPWVQLKLTERVGSRLVTGYGEFQVTCTGSPQQLTIRAMPSSDRPFATGTALADASIGGCDETQTICGGESASETIRITK